MTIYKIIIEFLAGTDITDASRQALQIATFSHSEVIFNFNGVELSTKGFSKPVEIANKYFELQRGELRK